MLRKTPYGESLHGIVMRIVVPRGDVSATPMVPPWAEMIP
jgi:hypothetical protein